MSKEWHKDDLMEYYPSIPYITPLTYWGCFGYSPSCDLEMTLSWPWGNTHVKPNPNPWHHVYLGWDSSNVFEVLAIGPNMLYERGVIEG